MHDSTNPPTQLQLPFIAPEEWRPIPGYDGIYEVSNRGQVRIMISRRNGHKAGDLLSQSFSADGYFVVGLRRDGKSRGRYVHRLVMLAFVGEPGDNEVNHKNGIKTDNNLENLEYMSHGDNTRHSVYVLKVYRVFGEAHPQAKVTENDVRTIRQRHANGEGMTALAREYGMSDTGIYQIVKRVKWKHVE